MIITVSWDLIISLNLEAVRYLSSLFIKDMTKAITKTAKNIAIPKTQAKTYMLFKNDVLPWLLSSESAKTSSIISEIAAQMDKTLIMKFLRSCLKRPKTGVLSTYCINGISGGDIEFVPHLAYLS